MCDGARRLQACRVLEPVHHHHGRVPCMTLPVHNRSQAAPVAIQLLLEPGSDWRLLLVDEASSAALSVKVG